MLSRGCRALLCWWAGFVWATYALVGPLAARAEAPDAGADEAAAGLEVFGLQTALTTEVLTATKLAQRASDTPAVITATSREQIHTYGWLSLDQVLLAQPGFAPAQDYERRTVSARGAFESWNNNHLLLLIDGVPFNDDIYGTAYTWEITPLFFAKQVEVVRGPGSALYGTNATNGVVEVSTLSPALGEARTEAQVRLGNAGTQAHDVLGVYGGSAFSTLVGFSYRANAGDQLEDYDGSGRTTASGALQRFPIRDGRSSEYAFAKVEGTEALRGLSLQYHLQRWEFQTGHGWLWWAPDYPESMHESRQLASLSYRSPEGGALRQEYVLRYQRHAIDWNMRFLPATADYPAGVEEQLQTHAQDLFARAQLTWRFWEEATALAGVEDTLFLYTGDEGHSANVDLNDPTGSAPGRRALGPWFEWVLDKPVNTVGVYAQANSGRVLHRLVDLTLGLRYDNESFAYTDLAAEGRPEGHKTFQQFSPRFGLVAFPAEHLTLKALAGRAFRAPAPAELFGANTWTLASNLAGLKPEVVTSYDLAVDWSASSHLALRANAFHRQFENQIAYSTANANLSTNLYSQTTAGLEGEVLLEFGRRSSGQVNGFLNASFFKLLDESVADPTIQADPSRLTGAPAQVANAGVVYALNGLSLAAQAHVQGPVRRRATDRLDPANAAARPEVVPAWASLDARAAYQVNRWLEVGLQGTNLTDTGGTLAKNNDYPFDYRIEGRRVLGTLGLTLE